VSARNTVAPPCCGVGASYGTLTNHAIGGGLAFFFFLLSPYYISFTGFSTNCLMFLRCVAYRQIPSERAMGGLYLNHQLLVATSLVPAAIRNRQWPGRSRAQWLHTRPTVVNRPAATCIHHASRCFTISLVWHPVRVHEARRVSPHAGRQHAGRRSGCHHRSQILPEKRSSL
jgi:hypothetical protein